MAYVIGAGVVVNFVFAFVLLMVMAMTIGVRGAGADAHHLRPSSCWWGWACC